MWPFGRRKRGDGDEAPPERQRVVLARSYPNEPLANLAVQVLADEGIKAFLKPAGVGFGGWGSSANLAHDLFVLEGDEARTRTVLAEMDAGEDEAIGEWR